MSKTLMIMRHGKSDWYKDYGSDFQRPLNKRGKRSAKAMGRFIGEHQLTPEVVITSSAVRAKRSAEHAMNEGNWKSSIEYTEKLYHFNTQEVMTYISNVDNCFERIMLVGHEPWCSEVLSNLCGVQVKFPTASLAIVELAIEDWRHTLNQCGKLTLFMPSRSLLDKS